MSSRGASWVRPNGLGGSEPRWGHTNGLQIGLHPLGGPRGLLRVYAPYLGHPSDRLVNFIAVEPTVVGDAQRGYSELESSAIDGEQGKVMWSADAPDGTDRQSSTPPARGIIESVDGVEQLRFFVHVEPFDNGADVYLRVSFRADKPHEVAIAAFARDGSAPLATCILSATMGNFARLRRLQLADRVVTPGQLWPDHGGTGFTEHARFAAAELTRNWHGDAVVSATPDEAEPQRAEYAEGTAEHWKYFGSRATQSWRVPHPQPQLEALVNGRHTYWASASPIPGGTSFENFELVEPFVSGREFFFSIEPLP